MRSRILGLLALASCAMAHDIPNDVTIQAFVKPAGERLNLLLRVPLKAMRDVEFPKRDQVYLDLARADQTLRDAAAIWIATSVEMYEGDTRLPSPRIMDTRASLESDRSFASYEQALAHVTGAKLPDSTQVAWDQVMLDVLLEYPIPSDRSEFSIRT